MADKIDLVAIQGTLVAIARHAGEMMRNATGKELETDEKMNAVDVVTETDKRIEDLVNSLLSKEYPTYSFVGEESYEKGVTKLTDAPTFICDPIDGTQNFIHGFPLACISLGFTHKKKPKVGVVYNPFADVLFSAIKGQGAFMVDNFSLAPGQGQGKVKSLPLSPGRKLGSLETALVGIEFGSQREGHNFDLKLEVYKKLTASKGTGGAMAGAVRSMGSAALNICYTAAGVMDIYWEGGCYAWDVAAGWCILEESGGRMVGGNPGKWDPAVDDRKYLAVREGGKEEQKRIVEEFWGLMGGRSWIMSID
ncbi:hypothetical protein B0T21DRAFT_320750 [Apiosordaria backusii]|uniref:Inositol-1-monophosphatase n=1 Tax=Apiosordaria backusii TaxID=314023 RepID=A0AA39ZVG0_9PEZI|nr:hypothetical protein B0T21DRAFT_320750 [Apiosordaria backusii]